MKKKILIITALLCAALMMLTGCSSLSELLNKDEASKFVGKWNAITATVDGVEFDVKTFVDEFSFTLNEDRTVIVKVNEDTTTARWEPSQIGFTVIDAVDETYFEERSDGAMLLDYDGMQLVLVKEEIEKKDNEKRNDKETDALGALNAVKGSNTNESDDTKTEESYDTLEEGYDAPAEETNTEENE